VLVNAAAIAVAKPRGDYVPPLLFARVRSPMELRLCRCTNAHTQERRAWARRGVR